MSCCPAWSSRPARPRSSPSPSGRWRRACSSWAVIGTADKVIPPAELLFMAQRAGARITDVNARHLSLISSPGPVTRVVIEAARAIS